MKTSESIKNIAPALLKAQKLMGGAKKGASNPYFKSKYADLGAVLEASKELLNEHGVMILQPHVANEKGNFVETILMHESGEFIASETMVVVAKQNDPQALGSAITYARRYGLQSLLSMPAEDDDGEGAMNRATPAQKAEQAQKLQQQTQAINKQLQEKGIAPAPVATKPAAAPAPSAPVRTSFKKPAEAPKAEAKPAVAEELGWDA